MQALAYYRHIATALTHGKQNMNEQLLHWHEGGSRCFRPTTLTELGKSEEFLEEVIYDNFGLLGLEQGQIGIRGPFQC